MSPPCSVLLPAECAGWATAASLLAGSERIASGAHGGSNVTGEHFKEACNINKSLTALGRVTTELVKSQKAGGGGHVPYRDSKLTFLLQVGALTLGFLAR